VGKQNQLPEAYLLRARAKEAAGDQAGAAEDYLVALRTVEEQRDRLHDPSTRSSFFDTAWELARHVVRFQVDRGDADAALMLADRIRAATIAPAEAFEGPLRRPSLGADEAVVFFTVAETRTLAWVLRSRDTSFHAIEVQERDLARLVARSTAAALSGSTPRTRQAGEAVFRAVVEPLRARLEGATRIVLIPDGCLHAVSWSALQDPSTKKLWGSDVVLAVAPCLRSLTRSPAPASDPAHFRVVTVGDPAFDRAAYPELPDLPGAAQEAEKIGTLYRDSVVLSGVQATADRFLAEAVRADLLHVGAHALPHAWDPEESEFVFAPGGSTAPDGRLTAATLEGRDLRRVRVVVLAACRSGDGPRSRIEGPLSLARPFLRDGARAVLVSLWDLPDEPVAAVMESLHRHVRAGADPSQALKRAAAECWSQPEPDPRACGGFQLILNTSMGG
jgi:CHAT domain-containing protein